jgi:hypothetical protein
MHRVDSRWVAEVAIAASLIAVALVSGACDEAGSASAAGATQPDGDITCATWARVPIPNTETVLINNVWNEQWADGQAYEQCLVRRTTEQGLQYGWRWAWPAYKAGSSYAAPEVVFGWKPWDGGASTTASLPKRIDALGSLTVDFAVELTADATHNLNTTMWLSKTDAGGSAINSADITTEVMVWFDNPSSFGGGNVRDGLVTLGGITFDVWHQVNHEDGSGGTTHTWTMATYISQTSMFEVNFDLQLVLDDLVSRGLVASTDAVDGVELITEVFGGSGQLWLDRFGVTATALP